MQILHASTLSGVIPVQYPIIQSVARNQWIDVNNESAVTLTVSLGGRIYLIPPNTTARYAMDNTETFVIFTPNTAADPAKDSVSGTIYNEQDATPADIERGASAADILPITSADIADGAIIAAKVASGAITTAAIVAGAVGTAQLANGAVTNPILASLAVATGNIQSGAVTNPQLGALSVATGNVQSGAVTNALLASLAVANANIQANAVQATQLATGAVTTTKIANLAVTTALIAGAAVGTAQIANAAITTALIANLAVTDALIANVSAGKITAGTISASISITSPTINGGTITGATIQTATSGGRWVLSNGSFGTQVLAGYPNVGEVTPAKLQVLGSTGAAANATIQMISPLMDSTAGAIPAFFTATSYIAGQTANNQVVMTDGAGGQVQVKGGVVTATPPGWFSIGFAGSPAFQNSWANFGSGWQPARYSRDAQSYVHIEGMIANASTTSATVFNLPIGYRPANFQTFAVPCNGGIARVDFNPSGDVNVADYHGGTAGFVALSGIVFAGT